MPAVVIVLSMSEWFRYFNPRPVNPIPTTILVLIVIASGAVKVIRGKKEIDRLKMARDGEKLVAEGLQELIKQGATVLHDIQGDKFNIDHVVVSKNGIT